MRFKKFIWQSCKRHDIMKRINPCPQQGGTSTIQQAIYQAHRSSCGQNLVIFEPIGITDIRYTDLKDILEGALNSQESIENWTLLREYGTNFLVYPSSQNKLMYIHQMGYWAQTLYNTIPDISISGYTYHLTVYDGNGFTIWDSLSPDLTVTKQTSTSTIYNSPDDDDIKNYAADGYIYNYTTIPLIPSNPYGLTDVNLYGISYNPGYFAYVDISDPIARDLLRSAFLANQLAMPETTMAVNTQLTDPANTRTFGFKNFGFSARQQQPQLTLALVEYFGNLAYYCCYRSELYTINRTTSTVIENVFVRLGLEQNIVIPTPP